MKINNYLYTAVQFALVVAQPSRKYGMERKKEYDVISSRSACCCIGKRKYINDIYKEKTAGYFLSIFMKDIN
jgi:hypothetical protein